MTKGLGNCPNFKYSEDQNFVDLGIYKDFLFNSQKHKNVKMQISKNQMRGGMAATMSSDSMMDKLILTRIINRQELCFGEDNRNRLWKITKEKDCHVCNKHKYTVIFYDRSTCENDYTKVRDKEAIEELKARLGLPKDKNAAPIILGSVTRSLSSPRSMLDADLFTLLSLIDSPKLTNTSEQISQEVIGGIKALYHTEHPIVKCVMPQTKHLTGYQLPLHDKLFKNGQTDVMAINPPEYVKKDPKKGLKLDKNIQVPFVYAEILPPGHHQFVIYDPQSDEMWFKEFILDANTKDTYPESPRNFYSISKPKLVQLDVWRKYKPPELHAFFSEQAFKGKTRSVIQALTQPGDDPEMTENFAEVALNSLCSNVETLYDCFSLTCSQSSSYPDVDS